MFSLRSSPAPEWNSGLVKQNPLKGTVRSNLAIQSPLVDFALLAPNSIPGRDGSEARDFNNPTFLTYCDRSFQFCGRSDSICDRFISNRDRSDSICDRSLKSFDRSLKSCDRLHQNYDRSLKLCDRFHQNRDRSLQNRDR